MKHQGYRDRDRDQKSKSLCSQAFFSWSLEGVLFPVTVSLGPGRQASIQVGLWRVCFPGPPNLVSMIMMTRITGTSARSQCDEPETTVTVTSLVFGGFAFPPVSLGPTARARTKRRESWLP